MALLNIPFFAPTTMPSSSSSLRAWAPVFVSLAAVLGPAIFERLHPDWREDLRRAVISARRMSRAPPGSPRTSPRCSASVALSLHERQSIGEIVMITVDPTGSDVGHQLRAQQLGHFSGSPRRARWVAMKDTGGDPGRAPARRTYEKAGLTPFPVVRYFKAL